MNHPGTPETSHTPAIHRVATRSLLVDLGDLDTVMAWHAHLSHHPLIGQVETIAAAQTILITFSSRFEATAALETLGSFTPGATHSTDSAEHVLDVCYDGEDLEGVAQHLGISTEELITRHSQQRWLAAFGGFAPGFTYCVAHPKSTESYGWDIPRRSSPRTAVPTGAVALAGNFSAVYPRTSPGGWQLIGHTAAAMWDTNAAIPALLSPGDTVRYRATRESISAGSSTPPEVASTKNVRTRPAVASRPALSVEEAGLQTLFQDTGRRGYGDLGVTHSGALDRTSAHIANDALGNPRSATVLENIGGLRLTAHIDTAVCVTGAKATVTVGGRAAELACPLHVRAGDQITVEPIGGRSAGLRSYLAVRGGFIAPATLGSSSTDSLSGLGPAPVSGGDMLRVGRRTAETSVGTGFTNELNTPGVLRCVAGPRDDWFAPGELERFTQVEWVVTAQSNRIGLRLALPDTSSPTDDGGSDTSAQPPLRRAHEAELASEGMVTGSIQVPPNGLPVVFLADHPVTGGYPVIATVIDPDLDAAGQLAPGDRVRFSIVDPVTLAPLLPNNA